MFIETSKKGYLVNNPTGHVTQALHVLFTESHPALSLQLLWCCCPVLSPSLLREMWERWLYCCGSCLLRLGGNLTPACSQAMAEGHRIYAQCSIQGQSSKILNTTMCWQRDISTMGTMARAELCILIPLLFIFRFGDVLKCMDAVCALFMVKTCFMQHLHSKRCLVLSSNTHGWKWHKCRSMCILVYLIGQVSSASWLLDMLVHCVLT